MVLLGVCAMLPAIASWAAVSARFDRSTVRDGDVATLTIESDGASSGEPDLTPLRKDFDVLGTSENSQVSFVNGRRSDRKRWVVQLQPRHLGAIGVPAIAVGNEQTAALTLTVSDAAPENPTNGGRHAVLESEVGNDSGSIYVQQQIPYTIRLYYDDTIEDGALAAPTVQDAIVEQLGDDKRFTTMRDGHPYNVLERRFAIAPEKSGTLHIPAATFHGRAAVAPVAGTGNDQADSFFARMLRDSPLANDPMFRDGLLGRGPFAIHDVVPVAARSKEMSLNVRPRPAGVTGSWLPAEQVTLRDSWSDHPPQFRVGEPVTRTITIDVKGLAASQIPVVNVGQPEHVRQYVESSTNQSRTDGKAVYGTSNQSVTYIPTAQGTLTIPAIDLDWWNTHTDSASRATLPALRFDVSPGAAGAGTTPLPATAGAAASTAPAPIAASPASALQGPPQSILDGMKAHAAWLIVGTMALLVTMAMLVMTLRLRRANLKVRRMDAIRESVQPQLNLTAAMRALRQACAANDPHLAAQALLQVGRVQWPSNPPRGLRALASKVQAGRDEIMELERTLYAAGAPAWKGTELWNTFRPGREALVRDPVRGEDGLQPLYP